MQIERFEAKGLAHFSYILTSMGEAVVIDPERNPGPYLEYLAAKKLTLRGILETHIHADYASGAPELAALTGAPLYLSAYDEGEDFAYQFPHRETRDGDEIHAGDLRIVAYHTPGHTPEHLSFLVYEKSRCGQPLALFSGDFVFVGSLGRPDLLGEDAKRALAASLYRSVHQRIETLPDGLLVYPAHGAGSLCGANLSDRPYTTLGYERFCNVFMADQPEGAFIEQILSTVPEFPAYYRRMKALNSKGAPHLNGLPGGALLCVDAFADAIEEGAQVVDLRRGEAFGGAYIAKSVNIGAGPSFGLWAPWVLDYDRSILLVGEDAASLEDARRALVRVGLDRILGSLEGGIPAWLSSGRAFSTIPQRAASELQGQFVVDVRSPAEFAKDHAPGAINIPAGEISSSAGELRGRAEVPVICGSSYRSSLAASLLAAAGIENVVNIAGGMAALKRAPSCSLRS